MINSVCSYVVNEVLGMKGIPLLGRGTIALIFLVNASGDNSFIFTILLERYLY
jgi:hypothetical protein